MSLIGNKVSQYGKNLLGWTTSRKLVVLSVDDYGNIRMASEQARQNLKKSGLPVDANRFDQYDCLEDAEDLSQLFDVLNSVHDKNGKSAVFTAYALPANIDFERMQNENFAEYRYKLLIDTFSELPGYEGTWKVWKEGISAGLMCPEFHGREHLNIPLLMRLLAEKNNHLLTCITERSLGALDKSHIHALQYYAPFDFEEFSQNTFFKDVIRDGLNVFEQVFGTRAQCFNAPGVPAHNSLEEELHKGGVRYIDSTFVKREHQGRRKFHYKLNYFGKRNNYGQPYLIRNCVFEPGLTLTNAVDQCLSEIEIAFMLKKPANISSHRVNFCGHINPKVREQGLRQLQTLLQAIVRKWPTVEFVTAREVGAMIESN